MLNNFLEYPKEILNLTDPGPKNWRFHVPDNENITFMDGNLLNELFIIKNIVTSRKFVITYLH